MPASTIITDVVFVVVDIDRVRVSVVVTVYDQQNGTKKHRKIAYRVYTAESAIFHIFRIQTVGNTVNLNLWIFQILNIEKGQIHRIWGRVNWIE